MRKILPSLEHLRQCFRYEKTSGLLFWKKRPREHFSSTREWKRWNTRHAGTEAFSYAKEQGYKTGSIDGTLYLAHRVIWKLTRGTEPPENIDHHDRKSASNRAKNLREATHSQNFINRVSTVGQSGLIGVRKSKWGTWEARIHKDKRYFHLGTFPTQIAAAKARAKAARQMYGDFAP